ncbi:unnamed protein product [Pleuronectes platessa]|uniref:Uncharacterized protein n=1 Tax=Pleuronectes platessa TaxID=8262 RepID=A0A9N7UGM4_PLEPL|nr:unnamed protein product [Pleuronectes platessa]
MSCSKRKKKLGDSGQSREQSDVRGWDLDSVVPGRKRKRKKKKEKRETRSDSPVKRICALWCGRELSDGIVRVDCEPPSPVSPRTVGSAGTVVGSQVSSRSTTRGPDILLFYVTSKGDGRL